MQAIRRICFSSRSFIAATNTRSLQACSASNTRIQNIRRFSTEQEANNGSTTSEVDGLKKELAEKEKQMKELKAYAPFMENLFLGFLLVKLGRHGKPAPTH
jgi:hypothetical protein